MLIAAFLIALLCGLGVGSGGLFVVYLTVFCNYEQLTAQGFNLLFFIFSTAAALIIHTRARALPIKRLFLICALGILGACGGAMLAQRINGDILRKIFAVFLILSGTLSLFSRENFQKTLYK